MRIVVHLVTMILLNFRKYLHVLTWWKKSILLLVIYFPPVAFLYEDYFLTIGCNIDCCVVIYIWNRNNGVLRVTATENMFGIATTENVFGVAMVSWSRNMRSTLGVVHLELHT
jgi:hypothetical protein